MIELADRNVMERAHLGSGGSAVSRCRASVRKRLSEHDHGMSVVAAVPTTARVYAVGQFKSS